MMIKRTTLLLTALLLLISCRSQDLIRPGDSLEVAYEKSWSLYERERWRDAAQSFETVLSLGRGTDIGQNAQFYLAMSYFNNRQYLLASSEFERYSISHPASPRRETADYHAALGYYRMSPRYNIDQANSRRAIERFRLFLARYPQSEKAQEASEIIDELRDKMAQKTFQAAQFYMQNNRYRSAAIYYELVIDRYPETGWAEHALATQIRAYIRYADNSIPERQEERYRKAVESYERYIQLFPRGEHRSLAETYFDEANEALQRFDTGEEVAATENR